MKKFLSLLDFKYTISPISPEGSRTTWAGRKVRIEQITVVVTRGFPLKEEPGKQANEQVGRAQSGGGLLCPIFTHTYPLTLPLSSKSSMWWQQDNELAELAE